MPGRSVPICRFVLPLLLGLAQPAGPALAQAEGAPVGFGGLRGDPTLPVEVTADQLRVNQADATALFTGNVVVGQGLLRLTAAELRVEYDETGQSISRMHATGGVTLANGAETAEAQEAVYTIATGEVVMTGDVLLTQGTSAISGSRLDVDLTTGTGLMAGRVTTVFVPATTTP